MIINIQVIVLLLVGQCQACLPGYLGNNCSLTCRVPSYGLDCQMACKCGQEHCNHITGCINTNVTDIQPEDRTKTRTERPAEINDISKDACSVGYFGPNCSLPCRYPNYGLGCQLNCNCEREHCNHITGCQNSSIGSSTDTGSPSKLGCPFMKMNERKSSQQKYMLIAICFMTTFSFVFITVYVRFKMKTNVNRNYSIKYKHRK